MRWPWRPTGTTCTTVCGTFKTTQNYCANGVGVCVLTSPGRVQEELVEKVARLARIRLSEEEKRVLAADFHRILEFFGRIDEARLEEEPMFHAGGAEGFFRDDEPGEPLPGGEAVAMAPDRSDGYFKAPWRGSR